MVNEQQANSCKDATSTEFSACTYPYCVNQSGHATSACGVLHRYCREGCQKRGHNAGGCARSRKELVEMAAVFKQFAQIGALTRRGADWDHEGPMFPAGQMRFTRALTTQAFIPWDGESAFGSNLTDVEKAQKIKWEINR